MLIMDGIFILLIQLQRVIFWYNYNGLYFDTITMGYIFHPSSAVTAIRLRYTYDHARINSPRPSDAYMPQ